MKPSSGIYLIGKLDRYGYWDINNIEVHTVDFGLEQLFGAENSSLQIFQDFTQKGQLIAHLKVKTGMPF